MATTRIRPTETSLTGVCIRGRIGHLPIMVLRRVNLLVCVCATFMCLGNCPWVNELLCLRLHIQNAILGFLSDQMSLERVVALSGLIACGFLVPPGFQLLPRISFIPAQGFTQFPKLHLCLATGWFSGDTLHYDSL